MFFQVNDKIKGSRGIVFLKSTETRFWRLLKGRDAWKDLIDIQVQATSQASVSMGKQAFCGNLGKCLWRKPENKASWRDQGYTCQSQKLGSFPVSTGMLPNNHEMAYPAAQAKEKFSKGLWKIPEQETCPLKNQNFDGVLNLEHMD